MKKTIYFFVFALLLLVSSNGYSQFKNYGIKGGLQFNGLMPFSEFDSKFSFIGRGFLDFELTNSLALELGVGYGQYNTDDNFNEHDMTGTSEHAHDVKTNIIPIDARLKITPWSNTKTSWNPYFYLGAGLLNYSVKETPDVSVSPQYSELSEGWTGFVPVGVGTEIKLSKSVMLDLHVGASYTFSDLLNNFVIEDYKDSWLEGGLGISFGGTDCNIDEDKDGLMTCLEQQIGTNPLVADTDADGLNDGAEYNTYKTDPKNKDTDGDTLTDGMEVNTYNTNPLNKDTDADGLMDNEEVNNYKTDPLDSDSDNDELMDGAEVKTHRTNPLNPDTDAGSIFDGVEVARGTDPLNPADDVPPVVQKEEPIKVGQVITLEGINFATNSAEISSLAEDKLERALNAMKEYPNLEVEISGHTDNTGGRAHNMRLSERRAESVKAWFVSKGIDASRISTTGYGPDQPVDTNDTEEGRFKNRRIDFKRTK